VNTDPTFLNALNTSLSVLLFLIGLLCLLTRRNAIRQVIGLKIMLQAATLGLIHAGCLSGDVHFAETMVASALIAETVVIAIATALIVNIFRSYPSGDVDLLTRLRG
jgi:NADH-quinone oxidoreductase subunit K